ncbi:hypothetical protein [uncultured Kocuria sp.]|uniref:hypothetical protein n=1 Tax=uncultured Kocuria sp. TaxID=259305 RepID=UPI00261E2363|nr:hypothetical protein [uncultured Kocuria sp.]
MSADVPEPPDPPAPGEEAPPSPPPPPQRLWTTGFVLMWAGQFLISMNFYLLVTVMALYAMERFGMATTVLPAAVQALIPAHRRGEGTGSFMLSTTLAAALGPLAGLSLSTAVGYGTLFVVCTAIALLGLAVGAVTRVPELSFSPEHRAGLRSCSVGQFGETRALPVSALMLFVGVGVGVGVGYGAVLSAVQAAAVVALGLVYYAAVPGARSRRAPG